MAAKPKAFAEPSSPIVGFCGFRNMDLMLRVLSVMLCIAILVVGGVATSRSGVILIGILGPPVSLRPCLSRAPLCGLGKG